MRMLRAFALIFTSIIFFQCQKEVSFIGGPDPLPATPSPITAIIQGNVLDETGQPASGVAIRVGSKTATTDAKGYFRIKDAALDKNASLVTAEKPGYFKAYRTFGATNGANQVTIKLTRKSLAGAIDAVSGGEAGLNNGMKVKLPANGVVVAATGAAYTGSVNVFAAFIDPSAQDIGQTVPGSFIADDRNGGRVALASYGMMAIELESSTGEKLQIKTGSKATLTNPIPASLQSSAPANIALWYVDETTGIWKEEGSASKNGNNYVGDVSHFSFWNCDIGIPAVTVTFTFKTGDGEPLVHAMVRLKTNTPFPTFSWGHTDSLGQVSGLVPTNQVLAMDVYDLCYNSIYNQNVGPFTQATSVAPIGIPTSTPNIITVKGTLLKCSGSPVTSGYAMLVYNNTVRYDAVDANGKFSISFIRCASSPSGYEVTAVDEAAQQQGATVTGNLSGSVNDIGNLAACGTTIQQYINYSIDGISYNLAAPVDSLMAYTFQDSTQTSGYSTYINGMRLTGGAVVSSFELSFNHSTQANGTYQATVMNNHVFQQTTLDQPFNVVITNFPSAPGQFYEGSFSGTFTANVTHTVTGTFRIRKNF